MLWLDEALNMMNIWNRFVFDSNSVLRTDLRA